MRGRITAAWWYTVAGVLAFEVIMALLIVSVSASLTDSGLEVALVAIGSAIWVAATVPLLIAYRGRDETDPVRGRTLALLLVCALCGAGAWLVTGMWVATVFAIAQPIVMLDWPRGVRVRIVIAITILLAALWFIDVQRHVDTNSATFAFFTVATPAMTVLTLWWWDILLMLDTARLSESRTSAAQERLRIATDLHDLQGHHLQVIALQLELIDRLWERDPAAAREHVRIARGASTTRGRARATSHAGSAPCPSLMRSPMRPICCRRRECAPRCTSMHAPLTRPWTSSAP